MSGSTVVPKQVHLQQSFELTETVVLSQFKRQWVPQVQQLQNINCRRCFTNIEQHTLLCLSSRISTC